MMVPRYSRVTYTLVFSALALLAGRAAASREELLGWAPLHIAAALDNPEAVRTLIALGANPEGRTVGRLTPLYVAAKRGRTRGVAALLAHGADVNSRNSDVDFTPLHVAAQDRRVRVAELLLAHGADANARSKQQQTPLWQSSWQSWHGDSAVGAVLIRYGADVNARDAAGFTPLHLAVDANHIPQIQLLMRAGANLDARNNDDATPLRWAIREQHFDAFHALLDAGADIDAPGHEGRTVLHTAAAVTPSLCACCSAAVRTSTSLKTTAELRSSWPFT